MRKIVLLLLFGVLSSPLFAQGIGFRDDDGTTLSIGTNYRITRSSGDYSTGVSLAVGINRLTNIQTFLMGIYFETCGKMFCQKHSRAVLKTFSGSIVTVEQCIDSYKVQENREAVGGYDSNIFSLTPCYIIQESDLNTLMNEGIKVLRIETSKGLMDFTYKSDVLGAYLKSEYKLLLEKRDFESNF